MRKSFSNRSKNSGEISMKIVCKKGNDAKRMLALVRNLLETETMDYPALKEDFVLEVFLCDADGQDSPKNEAELCFDRKDLQASEMSVSVLEHYYNNDALTNLYNRGKYERDIIKFQKKDYQKFTCIYVDAVGLHELNNHLGHAAGDCMLRSIADAIRRRFAHHPAYRVGGDEFVIFCLDQKEPELVQAVQDLRKDLHRDEYEISLGVYTGNAGELPINIINRAEQAMRTDKEEFYKTDGAARQMRTLNVKLEKLLLEKQDASQFLDVIADEYKGVYMVNADMDTCRHIYVPPYFQALLKKYEGCYSLAIGEYCRTLVRAEDQHLFDGMFDYEALMARLKCGEQISFTYEKTDGNKIFLKITIYDSNSSDNREMLWIFMDANKSAGG